MLQGKLQKAKSAFEIDVFNELDETNNIAAGLAAEAVKKILFTIDRKGRRPFLVKGTETYQAGAALLQVGVPPGYLYQGDLGNLLTRWSWFVRFDHTRWLLSRCSREPGRCHTSRLFFLVAFV